MSGYNRKLCKHVTESYFLAAACAAALSRIADKLLKARLSAGMEISYNEIDISNLLKGEELSVVFRVSRVGRQTPEPDCYTAKAASNE